MPQIVGIANYFHTTNDRYFGSRQCCRLLALPDSAVQLSTLAVQLSTRRFSSLKLALTPKAMLSSDGFRDHQSLETDRLVYSRACQLAFSIFSTLRAALGMGLRSL